MIFKKPYFEKEFEKFILHEFGNLCGVAISYLSKQEGHDLFLDLKDAKDDYVYTWFYQSGLKDELEDMVEPDEDSIYDLVGLIFKKGLSDGCLEINKNFIMTNGYKKALEHLVNYNFNLITKANKETINSIRKTITQAVASGEGHPKTVKKLSEIDLAPSTHFTPRQRADMISRTEVNRAFNVGNLNAYKSWGVSQIELMTAGDRLVCSYCMEIESTNPHKIGEIEPPLHPRCRCAVAPYIDKDMLNEVNKEESVMAKVPDI